MRGFRILERLHSASQYTIMKPAADKDLQYGPVRVSMTNFNYEKPGIHPLPPVIREKAKALYPRVFSDDWASLPVHMDIKRSDTDSSGASKFLFDIDVIEWCSYWPWSLPPVPGFSDLERGSLLGGEQAERAKDKAQAMVEKGQGDPAPERELSVLCRQRIEVLKPVLAAIKGGASLNPAHQAQGSHRDADMNIIQ